MSATPMVVHVLGAVGERWNCAPRRRLPASAEFDETVTDPRTIAAAAGAVM